MGFLDLRWILGEYHNDAIMFIFIFLPETITDKRFSEACADMAGEQKYSVSIFCPACVDRLLTSSTNFQKIMLHDIGISKSTSYFRNGIFTLYYSLYYNQKSCLRSESIFLATGAYSWYNHKMRLGKSENPQQHHH